MGLEDAIRIIADTHHPSVRAQILGHLPVPAADPAIKAAAIAKAKAALAEAEATPEAGAKADLAPARQTLADFDAAHAGAPLDASDQATRDQLVARVTADS